MIRPGGELVVVFLWAGSRIGSTVSADGGATFGAPTIVAQVEVRTIRELRFFPLLAADVDPSGRIWATWHDCGFSPGCSENSVVVSTSTDRRTWTTPSAISSGKNAMLPAVGINPVSGRAAFVYYVIRPGGVDAELVEVGPDGRRLAPPRRLSSQTMRLEWMPNTVSGHMLADYISVHYAGRTTLRRLDSRLGARRLELPASGLRNPRLGSSALTRGVRGRRLEPDRVPGSLQLEERLDLPGSRS